MTKRKHYGIMVLSGLLSLVALEFFLKTQGSSLVVQWRTQASSAVGSQIRCSSQSPSTDQMPGDHRCANALENVAGEWVSNGEGVGAWIELNFGKDIALNAVRLYDRGSADDIIVDGHFEFSDGSRYPALGGIAQTAKPGFPNARIQFAPAVRSSTLRFVVDAVGEHTKNVGLAEITASFTVATGAAPQRAKKPETVFVASQEAATADSTSAAQEVSKSAPLVCLLENDHQWYRMHIESIEISPEQPKVGVLVSFNMTVTNDGDIADVFTVLARWDNSHEEIVGPLLGTVVKRNSSTVVKFSHVFASATAARSTNTVRFTLADKRNSSTSATSACALTIAPASK